MKLASHRWQDLSTHDFRQLDMSRIVAILPVAAIEQHGPHLPVSVDTTIVEGVVRHTVEQMPEDLPALILPTMPVGKSDEHIDFPGTLTLSAGTLAQMWFEIGASVHRSGVRRMILINAHGGQPQIMETVCRRLRVELDMFAVGAQWFGFTDISDLFDAQERHHGIHAGEIETSLMRYLCPQHVNMDLAENFTTLSQTLEARGGMLAPEGGAVSFGWKMQDLNPKGAAGNASAADAGRGRLIVERAASAFLKLVREVADYPLTNLVAQPHPAVTFARNASTGQLK